MAVVVVVVVGALLVDVDVDVVVVAVLLVDVVVDCTKKQLLEYQQQQEFPSFAESLYQDSNYRIYQVILVFWSYRLQNPIHGKQRQKSVGYRLIPNNNMPWNAGRYT
jgi:hypothetical protein